MQYWKNKLIKLLPLYYTMTVIAALGYVLIPSAFRSTVVSVETLIKSFLFLPCRAGNGKVYPVYSIGWTMNLEMFFYLLFFAAMKVSHKHRGGIAMGSLGALILVGMAAEPQDVVLHFWTQVRLIDFIAGIGMYCVEKEVEGIRISRWICFAGIGISLPMLFSGMYLLGDCFSCLWNTFWGTGILCFCLSLKKIRAEGFMKRLGDMSYSIYMVHFLIIGTVCRRVIDNTRISWINTGIVVAAMIVSIGCAGIVYQIFEIRLKKYLNGIFDGKTEWGR